MAETEAGSSEVLTFSQTRALPHSVIAVVRLASRLMPDRQRIASMLAEEGADCSEDLTRLVYYRTVFT